jgi:hypothetical protein
MNKAPGSKCKKDPVAARLFFIMARKSHTAVIFRRGPSKWVQLIKWDTKTDTFEPGQWFHGRIYEKRGDLSPDGSLLIYFAQKISARTLKDKEYTYAWTAISKPPYLTALALWPKADCWDGDGLFPSNKAVHLNHMPGAQSHPHHKPPGWLHVSPKTNQRGEDDPIFSERLARDGWTLKQEWKIKNLGHPKWLQTLQPEIWEKTGRNRKQVLRLSRSAKRLQFADEFSIIGQNKLRSTVVTGANCADWDQNGRLVFARDGKVFAGKLNDSGVWSETELADFNSSRPEPVRAPLYQMVRRTSSLNDSCVLYFPLVHLNYRDPLAFAFFGKYNTPAENSRCCFRRQVAVEAEKSHFQIFPFLPALQ